MSPAHGPVGIALAGNGWREGEREGFVAHRSDQEVSMSFRITGLSPDPFKPLFGLSDEDLAKHGARRYVADKKPGYPDRIEMREAELGETVLLLNHVCQPAETPYRATH